MSAPEHLADAVCDACGEQGSFYASPTIVRACQYFIVQMGIMDVFTQTKLPGVIEASASIEVAGRVYKLIGAIQHIGSGLKSGHYVAHVYRHSLGCFR